MAKVSLSLQGAYEWKQLSKKLKGAAQRDLRAALRKRLQDAGRPILDEVKDAAHTIPITSDRGGGTNRRRTYNSLQAGRRARKSGKNVRAAIARGGRRKAGLRDSVARATKLQINTRGIRFYVDSSAMPESQRTLPRHLDSPKGWRHPVFGSRERWVHQQGRPWFATTIQKRAPKFRQAALDAIEDTKRQIES